MKNYAEQQMGAVMDPNAFNNQIPAGASYIGKPTAKKPELEDVRAALIMARELAERVQNVETTLLGEAKINSADTKPGYEMDGIFPQLATSSRDACAEMRLAGAALDRILASI